MADNISVMKVNCVLVYPAFQHCAHCAEQHIPIRLNIGCPEWQTNTAMRHGFCELIFAGAGNHPGLWDGDPDHEFDAGDRGINNVHRQWAEARTRSASVGDLVNIDPAGLNEWWVCDVCGWTLLTTVQAKNWLEYPRQSCSSFELNKWLDSIIHTCTESPKQHCKACTQELASKLKR